MSRRTKRMLGRIGFYLLLAVIIFYTVFPFYWAIVSSLKNKPLPPKLVVFGEVGLAGDVDHRAKGQERDNRTAGERAIKCQRQERVHC